MEKFTTNKSNNLCTYKGLAVFDFDHTIVDNNTDAVARSLISSNLISDEIQKMSDIKGWTKYMQEIFRLLHKNNFDLIIISDSNSEFIRQWNNAHGLSETFLNIFTNPGWFEDNGLLKIEPYHQQTECKLSPINLCKGKILKEFIQSKANQGINYEQVFYVGDGTNDICPLLKLTERDFGCPRKGFSMDKKLFISNISVRAKLLRWSSGFELLNKILETISN